MGESDTSLWSVDKRVFKDKDGGGAAFVKYDDVNCYSTLFEWPLFKV